MIKPEHNNNDKASIFFGVILRDKRGCKVLHELFFPQVIQVYLPGSPPAKAIQGNSLQGEEFVKHTVQPILFNQLTWNCGGGVGEVLDAGGARAVAQQRDAARVAAEAGRVLTYPLQK